MNNLINHSLVTLTPRIKATCETVTTEGCLGWMRHSEDYRDKDVFSVCPKVIFIYLNLKREYDNEENLSRMTQTELLNVCKKRDSN